MVDGQLIAAAQRQPAQLNCDGERSIAEQISELNADPNRGVAYERLLNRVPIDNRLLQGLTEQGWALESVPPAGTSIQLSRTANISQGGTAMDCTDQVHADNRRLAEDIAVLIGSDVVGLDLISRDIGVSWREGGTWLLEANLSAGLRPHLVAHPQTDLCQRIVQMRIGAGPRAGQIPTALITGSIGKTTTSRMLAHLLQTTGLRVGLCSSTGVELNGEVIQAGDQAGGGAALRLLQDRRVEALVGEIARGGILQSGLGIERCEVAAVLHVLDNHLGVDGIRTRQDLARIKAVVARSAQQVLVLNADDPLVLAMGQGRDPHTLALVGEEPCSTAWHTHRLAGHRAVSYRMDREGMVRLYHHNREQLGIQLRSIPASDDGTISTIAMAAACSAALAHGLGLTAEQIQHGLQAYGTAAYQRNGRFERLMAAPWTVVLTWADGPQAMASLSSYALAATEAEPRRRVLLCSAADNRPDDYLRLVGQACWGFDLVICAARDRRRGREKQEVPSLLAEGARSLGPGGPEVLVAGTELEAVAVLAQQLRPGDFCVVCTFESNVMRQALLAGLR